MSFIWLSWLGWSLTGLLFLGVLVWCLTQGSDLDHLRARVDLLEEQRGELRADLSEGLDIIHDRVDSIALGERTDTEDIVKQFHGATAYGKHSHREPA